MKTYFRKYNLWGFASENVKRSSLWMIVVVCSVSAISGSYLLRDRFGLWSILVIGIVGMAVGIGTYVFRHRNAIHETHGRRAWKTVPGIASSWDYRPRDSSLRSETGIPNTRGEAIDARSALHSTSNENTDGWFNFESQESDTEVADDNQTMSENVCKA